MDSIRDIKQKVIDLAAQTGKSVGQFFGRKVENLSTLGQRLYGVKEAMQNKMSQKEEVPNRLLTERGPVTLKQSKYKKTSGDAQGSILKENSGQLHMVKPAFRDVPKENPHLDFNQRMEQGRKIDAIQQQKTDNRREYLHGKVFQTLLKGAAPKLRIAVPQSDMKHLKPGQQDLRKAKGPIAQNYAISSEFMKEFKDIKAMIESGAPLDSIKGLEEVILVSLFLGDPDFHIENVGLAVMENGELTAVKIDHGKAGVKFLHVSDDPKENARLLMNELKEGLERGRYYDEETGKLHVKFNIDTAVAVLDRLIDGQQTKLGELQAHMTQSAQELENSGERLNKQSFMSDEIASFAQPYSRDSKANNESKIFVGKIVDLNKKGQLSHKNLLLIQEALSQKKGGSTLDPQTMESLEKLDAKLAKALSSLETIDPRAERFMKTLVQFSEGFNENEIKGTLPNFIGQHFRKKHETNVEVFKELKNMLEAKNPKKVPDIASRISKTGRRPTLTQEKAIEAQKEFKNGGWIAALGSADSESLSKS